MRICSKDRDVYLNRASLTPTAFDQNPSGLSAPQLMFIKQSKCPAKSKSMLWTAHRPQIMPRIVSLACVIFLLPLLIRVVQDEIFGVDYPLLRAMCEKIDSPRCSICRGPSKLLVCLWHIVRKCFQPLLGDAFPVSLRHTSTRSIEVWHVLRRLIS